MGLIAFVHNSIFDLYYFEKTILSLQVKEKVKSVTVSLTVACEQAHLRERTRNHACREFEFLRLHLCFSRFANYLQISYNF